jgi:hypothetical protein
MVSQPEFLYDVFISHSSADREWVDAWLLPRLEGAGLRVCVDYRDFSAGAARLPSIERAITSSRRTVAVLTPDWLASEWNAFEDILVRSLDPAALRRRLIPVKLKACELPPSLAALERVDLTEERRWEQGIQRLQRDVLDVVPVAAPWRQNPAEPLWTRWRRWLRRYRRQVRRGVALGVLVALLGLMVLGLPPFQDRPGWRALSEEMPQAWRLARAGDALLVSSQTDFGGCVPTDNPGLWRSADQGATWTPIVVPSLKVERLDRQCDTAAFADFASSPAQTGRVYGATWEAGLLRSEDGGQTWQRVGQEALPSRLREVAVDPLDPDVVIAAPTDKGLYRSQDGGSRWERLDASGVCDAEQEGAALPADFRVWALLFTADALWAGSNTGTEPPAAADGLYVSHDRGSCWRMVDGGDGRSMVRFLAAVPGRPDEILSLTKDFRAVAGTPEEALWRIAEKGGRLQELWSAETLPMALLTDERAPNDWHVATHQGAVVSGRIDRRQFEETPWLLPCALGNLTKTPLTCWTALAADAESPTPLLLAAGRVYRRDKVPWFRAIWPAADPDSAQ